MDKYFSVNKLPRAGTLYYLYFKSVDYIKIGFTQQYIACRIRQYTSTIYRGLEIDFRKSYVFQTNDFTIEDYIKRDLSSFRLDNRTEKFHKAVIPQLLEYLKNVNKEYPDLFYEKKPLYDFIPFSKSDNFFKAVQPKLNQQHLYVSMYEKYLIDNGLFDKYNPRFLYSPN